MIHPHDLKYFLEVANSLNITRASERLGITQPALSQSLNRLEDNFGVKLVVRSKMGVQLTKAGHRVVRQSNSLLTEWDNLKKAAKDEEDSLSGRFKLGCHPSVAIYSLKKFLPDFLEKYPEIELELKHGLSREIANDIISWKVDLGIVVNPPQHPDLVIKELCRDQVTFWRNTNCRNTNILIFNPELTQTQTLLQQLKKKKITFDRTIESSNLEVIQQLVASGAGVGVLPTRVAKLSSQLEKAFANAPEFEDRICLVYRAGTMSTAAAKVLVQSLLQTQI